MSRELSESDFGEIRRSEPKGTSRERALTLYRKQEEEWASEVDPVTFLLEHDLIDNPDQKGFWASGWSAFVAVGFIASAIFLFVSDEKSIAYVSELFSLKSEASVTDLSELPGLGDESKGSPAIRALKTKINGFMESGRWSLAIEEATNAFETFAEDLASDHELRIWLIDVVVASSMEKEGSNREDWQRVVDWAAKVDGDERTFTISYNELRANFELRGGADTFGPVADSTGEEQVLALCDSLLNRFGKEVSSDPARIEKLRLIRVMTLIRRLSTTTKLKDFEDDREASQRWDQLADLMDRWRARWPSGTTEDEIVKGWSEMPEDLRRCDRWYWGKIADFEPVFGTQVEIGGRIYDGNDAEFNEEMITESLK